MGCHRAVAESKCAPLIIRTEDLSAALARWLAHELCSKIEVTQTGVLWTGETRRTSPSRGVTTRILVLVDCSHVSSFHPSVSFAFVPLLSCVSCSCPIVHLFSPPVSPSPRRIRLPPSRCSLLFRRYIFSPLRDRLGSPRGGKHAAASAAAAAAGPAFGSASGFCCRWSTDPASSRSRTIILHPSLPRFFTCLSSFCIPAC